MAGFELALQGTAVAFADKSNAELRKRYWLFRLMNSKLFNKSGAKTAELSLKFHLPIHWAIKATIFKPFCGGETIEECAKRLACVAVKASAFLRIGINPARSPHTEKQTVKTSVPSRSAFFLLRSGTVPIVCSLRTPAIGRLARMGNVCVKIITRSAIG